MPNPSPTPLSPNPPYSALLSPTRPHSARTGPTACPTPLQPHSALAGPTRPYSAPLGPNRPPRGGLAWGHLRVQLLPVQSDTAGLSASVFLPVLGSAALAAAIKYWKPQSAWANIQHQASQHPSRVPFAEATTQRAIGQSMQQWPHCLVQNRLEK